MQAMITIQVVDDNQYNLMLLQILCFVRSVCKNHGFCLM
jgi:hypothetical protein